MWTHEEEEDLWQRIGSLKVATEGDRQKRNVVSDLVRNHDRSAKSELRDLEHFLMDRTYEERFQEMTQEAKTANRSGSR